MEKLSIIKIGGNIIEDENALNNFLHLFSKIKGKKLLVHGGGKKASQMSTKLGITSKMTNGRRITDAETLEVITMVYGGLVNKNIVAKLQSLNTNCIGLSGADGNCILSSKRPVKEVDYGFVGDVKNVNNQAIEVLINHDFTPVFCAITHDGNGQLLNTNADTITSQIAIGMSKNYETSIYYCFELNGVLEDINDKNSVIKHINAASYKNLLNEGIIADGMLPKLENCFDALKNGVHAVFMGNTTILTKENENFTKITL
ncbi:MAG: acetylglutamate kinase [Flavobacteriia bacterium]|nr:acetylglutamate kinase [Flavobacteriia bacterium]OIP48783.1 MAG: acetylglutamate kinase [Flavobacteriaceae bacterium CG2_30_31_66]PIV95502.1 MAG: acetylglutamate kinase [Flavobacteriaceae bacterium CG17_big_fil_post_rev_8_21_14_2_50_31_13]PIY14211.1 MAG: acetylglutamate kinase [Flavobacteriaceae bacterium CG_4_10_14_3_um_filter_31_253]PIZ10320.1 MAG: acetylglutamate kinase [Flavobacteriaceae bacterium CG_4_10_14_0_8_um_filter_31_99]PJC10301.1 MAG: acetylglutamate kinase [Flavobacteriaceae b